MTHAMKAKWKVQAGLDAIAEQQQQQQQQQNFGNDERSPQQHPPAQLSPSIWAVAPPTDVIHVTEVVWGINSKTGQSIKPKLRETEPCGCTPDFSVVRQQHCETVQNGGAGSANGVNAMVVQQAQPPPCCTDMSCVLFACQEECPRTCSASPYCCNRRISNREGKQVQVFDAGPKGRGLRASEDIREGEFIIEYVGLAVKKRDLDQLFDKYRDEQMLYIMSLDGDIYIDARKHGGVARYINHSCDPNCYVTRWKVNGVSRAAIFPRRFIPAGSELTFDYQWDRKRGRAPTKCHCNSKICRGTLEAPLAEAEDAMNQRLQGHWKTPTEREKANGELIVNRYIKVYFFGNQEWFVAKVAKYRPDDRHYNLLWHPIQEGDESWESLTDDKWMILDDEAEEFVIAKRKKKANQQPAVALDESAAATTTVANNRTGENQTYSSAAMWGGDHGKSPPSVVSEQTSMGMAGAVNANVSVSGTGSGLTFVVEAAVKDFLSQRRIIPRAESACRVNITMTRCSRADEESSTASPMGCSSDALADQCWRLTVLGLNLEKADSYLRKNIELAMATLHNTSPHRDEDETVQTSGLTKNSSNGHVNMIKDTIILPRASEIAEKFKSKVPLVRGRRRGMEISLASQIVNKNKSIDMYLLEGTSEEVAAAKTELWELLVPQSVAALDVNSSSCSKNRNIHTVDAPQTLSIRAGTLGHKSLYGVIFKGFSGLCARSDFSIENGGWKSSPFVTCFQKTQQCSVWLQREEGAATLSSFEKRYTIYISGVHPSQVPRLWEMLKLRAQDIQQGVEYLHKEEDIAVLGHIIQKTSSSKEKAIIDWNVNFKDYLAKSSCVDVFIDTVVTKGWIVLDGRKNIASGGRRQMEENLTLARQILQLELFAFRSTLAVEQPWCLGRHWPSIMEAFTTTDEKNLSSPPTTDLTSEAVYKPLCQEIAELAMLLNLPSSVAAHACIIFYRYAVLSSIEKEISSNSLFKPRDLVLASVYIANKSQKAVKFKGLEELLKHSTALFYSDPSFHLDSDAAKSLEHRVLSAECHLLEGLGYDVFWCGMEWIISHASKLEGVSAPLLENALAYCQTGPIFAAGPELWLQHGPVTTFLAVAGLLSIDIAPLVLAFKLSPCAVSCAASLIVKSLDEHKKDGDNRTSSSSSSAIKKKKVRFKSSIDAGTKSSMKQGLAMVVEQCTMIQHQQEHQRRPSAQESFSSRMARVILNVDPAEIMQRIIPKLSTLESQTNCRIHLDNLEAPPGEKCNILLDGNWRAVAAAECTLVHMLQDRFSSIDTIDPQVLQKARLSDLKELKVLADPAPKIDLKDILAVTEETTTDVAKNSKGGMLGLVKGSSMAYSGLGRLLSSPLKSSTGILSDSFYAQEAMAMGGEAQRANITNNYQSMMQSSKNALPSNLESASMSNFAAASSSPSTAAYDAGYTVIVKRWPSEKTEKKEAEKSRKLAMKLGFSALALQEMQLLYQLHNQTHTHSGGAEGNPYIVLPLAIGHPSSKEKNDVETNLQSSSLNRTTGAFPFQLLSASHFQTNLDLSHSSNTKTANDFANGYPCVLSEPVSFVLQDLLTRRKRNIIDLNCISGSKDDIITPTLFAAWFHDLLSACAACHDNHAVLRMIKPDQISIGPEGVAKLTELGGAAVLTPEQRKSCDAAPALESPDLYKFPSKTNIRERERDNNNSDDMIVHDPYQAPEMLLGSLQETKESDIWSIGAMMAALLLGKPLFTGKDRVTFLAGIFKIVGSPSNSNFLQAKKSYYYEKTKSILKRTYKPGADKALCFLLNDSVVEQQYAGAIDLLNRILKLDPVHRITATEALQHPWMKHHRDLIHSVTNPDHRYSISFAREWKAAQSHLLGKQPPPSTSPVISMSVAPTINPPRPGEQHIPDDPRRRDIVPKETRNPPDWSSTSPGIKENEVEVDDFDDDLYGDMNDQPPLKRMKARF